MLTALIIGASRGLGKALAEHYVEIGWRVIATVRDRTALGSAPTLDGDLEVETLDITDPAAIQALAGRLAGRRVDLLFVVAGVTVGEHDPIGDVVPDDFAKIMLVNALAPLKVIDSLAPLVPTAGTIAVMTSGLASIAANNTGGREAYRMSKAALNMGFKCLAIRRAAEGRTYIAASPGWVRTEMGGDAAPLSIEESVHGLVRMLERRKATGGIAFVAYDGQEWPW